MSETKTRLKGIIAKTSNQPTIVNESSRFVVATYWWGRGNFNANTARPCMFFYETFVDKVIKYVIRFFVELHSSSQTKINISGPDEVLENFLEHVKRTKSYRNVIANITRDYYYELYQDIGLRDMKDPEIFTKAGQIIETMKQKNETPSEYTLRPENDAEQDFFDIGLEIIRLNKQEIFDIFVTGNQVNTIKKLYLTDDQKPSKDITEVLLETMRNAIDAKTSLTEKIKSNLKVKQQISLPTQTYENVNIYDILNLRFRFRDAMKYEDMIAKWEGECAKFNCNYLAVEYPEFAQPGGYQMAINAKPDFIKKALELCKDRPVLYIDGDMFIRQYPLIFDMEGVDYMGRGWWMDPRSSYMMKESITYDPYLFETSGGIMYFSQSYESKQLVDAWIDESDKDRNAGKADDRIISLIFNSKKFLLNMNIVQLPIEYLWLTLDYDERMLADVYDWDEDEMKSTIIVEHPECLTSEETASGAGASSDRTPKYYSFISDEEHALQPVSEQVYEYLMFPNKTMIKAFEWYYKYMRNTTYINDGNAYLVENKMVFPDNPSANEHPLYITSYDDKFGDKNEVSDSNFGIMNNEIDENYLQTKLSVPPSPGSLVEMPQEIIPGQEYEIPIIMSLLSKGYSVLYKPTNCSPSCYTDIATDEKNKRLDLVFFPEMSKMSHLLKPVIDLTQPVLFRYHPESKDMMLNTLSIFSSLQDMSETFAYGSYHILSRIRMGYVFKPKNKTSVQKQDPQGQRGGGGISEEEQARFIKEYMEGKELMYGGQKRTKRRGPRRRTVKRTPRNGRRVSTTGTKTTTKKTHRTHNKTRRILKRKQNKTRRNRRH